VEEVALGVVDSLELPEDGGDLVEEVGLEGGGGAEVFLQLVLEGLVGGGAFVG